MSLRLKEAGDSALLLELEPMIDPAVNARVIAIADRVRGEAIRGVRDVVPTYRSVAVHFDPLVADVEAVRGILGRLALEPPGADSRSPSGVVEVPVAYGGEFGPDLDDVGAFGGLTAQQVIEHHAARTYRVFMLGFLPGFPYMGPVALEIAAPRRATPRTHVPRGSVGIAGSQTGIYPMESPGGWQIIGRTTLTLFDPVRNPPALFAPGDHVRFVPVAEVGRFGPPEGGPYAWGPASAGPGRTVTVLRPGLFTTIQDTGRWGYQAQGVPVSGAMDANAHRTANLLVGNDPGAATLEATLVGPELRLDQDATVAVAGANLSAAIDSEPLPVGLAVRATSGATIRFGERRHGARAYIAFDGGLDVPLVLGSRSTHVRSGLGGRALAAGDCLPLGGAAPGGIPSLAPPSPRSGTGARLRVMAGPHDEYFGPEAFGVLQGARFTMSSQSDRMGYRLQGGRIPRIDAREMISDATFAGGVQVPPSGDPILLMADRQTTGGYPQIATVITADLPLAAQLAPGDWIEFQLCTRAEAVSALAAHERA